MGADRGPVGALDGEHHLLVEDGLVKDHAQGAQLHLGEGRAEDGGGRGGGHGGKWQGRFLRVAYTRRSGRYVGKSPSGGGKKRRGRRGRGRRGGAAQT